MEDKLIARTKLIAVVSDESEASEVSATSVASGDGGREPVEGTPLSSLGLLIVDLEVRPRCETGLAVVPLSSPRGSISQGLVRYAFTWDAHAFVLTPGVLCAASFASLLRHSWKSSDKGACISRREKKLTDFGSRLQFSWGIDTTL